MHSTETIVSTVKDISLWKIRQGNQWANWAEKLYVSKVNALKILKCLIYYTNIYLFFFQ